MSGYVALCLPSPGAVVTWFVTGYYSLQQTHKSDYVDISDHQGPEKSNSRSRPTLHVPLKDRPDSGSRHYYSAPAKLGCVGFSAGVIAPLGCPSSLPTLSNPCAIATKAFTPCEELPQH